MHFDDSNSVNKDLIGKVVIQEAKNDKSVSESNTHTQELNLVESITKYNRSTLFTRSISTKFRTITDFNQEQINLNTRYIISDKHNNLLILNLNDNYLYRLNLYGKLINKYNLAIDNKALTPRGICLNDNEELFVTNIHNNKILKYTISSAREYEYYAAFGDNLNGPRGIECHEKFLFICDYNNKRIRIYDNKILTHANDIMLDENIHGSVYPFNIKIKFEKIFVNDLMNSIRIFYFHDFSFIMTIKHQYIIEPRGLIIDSRNNLCVSSKSNSNEYILYCFDVNGNYLNQIGLGEKDVFDVLVLKHPFNNDMYLYASLGDSGLINYKIEPV